MSNLWKCLSLVAVAVSVISYKRSEQALRRATLSAKTTAWLFKEYRKVVDALSKVRELVESRAAETTRTIHETPSGKKITTVETKIPVQYTVYGVSPEEEEEKPAKKTPSRKAGVKQ